MGYWKNRKQSPEHVAKRSAAMAQTRRIKPWDAGRERNTPAVLWSKVQKCGPDECWPWKGYVSESGYGRAWIDGSAYYAHRIIYDLVHPREIGLRAPQRKDAWGFIRHSCDNPQCCNPAHLIIGTHNDNMQDKVVRGRSNIWKDSTATPRAKLSADDVRWIRFLFKRGFANKPALAFLYDLSVVSIKSVLSGRTYVDIM